MEALDHHYLASNNLKAENEFNRMAPAPGDKLLEFAKRIYDHGTRRLRLSDAAVVKRIHSALLQSTDDEQGSPAQCDQQQIEVALRVIFPSTNMPTSFAAIEQRIRGDAGLLRPLLSNAAFSSRSKTTSRVNFATPPPPSAPVPDPTQALAAQVAALTSQLAAQSSPPQANAPAPQPSAHSPPPPTLAAQVATLASQFSLPPNLPPSAPPAPPPSSPLDAQVAALAAQVAALNTNKPPVRKKLYYLNILKILASPDCPPMFKSLDGKVSLFNEDRVDGLIGMLCPCCFAAGEAYSEEKEFTAFKLAYGVPAAGLAALRTCAIFHYLAGCRAFHRGVQRHVKSNPGLEWMLEDYTDEHNALLAEWKARVRRPASASAAPAAAATTQQ